MFTNLLTQCECNIHSMPCCHDDNRECYCYNCLQPGFYDGLDEYDCHKKMNFYVLKYGPSYISEIYYYLCISQILERFQGNINILSLGCGFSPDYYAISKYICDKNLSLTFHYFGWDKSQFWNSARLIYPNIAYQEVDLLKPFSFANVQIIMMNKIFSTLYRHNNHGIFLQNLSNSINNTMASGSILIFNDVNNYRNGRDEFDTYISPLFDPSNIIKYYTDTPEHPACTGYGTWLNIHQSNMIYETNYAPSVSPINFVTIHPAEQSPVICRQTAGLGHL